MKAAVPIRCRYVKVKSTGGKTPDEDTPELDTETVFELKDFPYDPNSFFNFEPQRPMYQTTVPFPMDKFGNVLSRMTAMQAGRYCEAICNREGWTSNYANMQIVLNNLDMEI